MSFFFTKYETGEDIKFDVSKFDYRYGDDDFPTTGQTDFAEIISEAGGSFVVSTETETIDGLGNIKTISQTSFDVTGWITDITKKDRKIHDMGLAIPGNRIIYLKHVYNTSVVKEGDILSDRKSVQWRIEKILAEPYLTNKKIYQKAVIKSINLEGST
jgi:hypothetical protein